MVICRHAKRVLGAAAKINPQTNVREDGVGADSIFSVVAARAREAKAGRTRKRVNEDTGTPVVSDDIAGCSPNEVVVRVDNENTIQSVSEWTDAVGLRADEVALNRVVASFDKHDS